MKNLKSAFEKEDVNLWKDEAVWEPSGKRNKRFRKSRSAKHANESRSRQRVRLTWD